jgi:hypothetical protein
MTSPINPRLASPCGTSPWSEILHAEHLFHARNDGHYCSLPLRRVHEIKCMYLFPRTHGLFIT